MARLRVLAGPNANDLTPISHLVNTSKAHYIKSNRFEGLVCVHVKGFIGTDGKMKESAYFNETQGSSNGGNGGMGNSNGGDRKGVTWSIQVTGRYLVDGLTSDDVLFGNTFDRPLKLPWGSGAALKFMHFVDPTLEHALDSDKPWALSPLIATMPYFSIHPSSSTPPKFEENSAPFHQHLQDDTTALSSPSTLSPNTTSSRSGTSTPNAPIPPFKSPSSRRSYFSTKPHRRAVPIHTTDIITTDFCYGFLSFPEIRLNIPGGISFDLMQYWDGQPVRFVCCERRREGDDSGSVSEVETDGSNGGAGKGKKANSSNGSGGLKGPGDPFWVVVFEAVLDDHKEVEERVSSSAVMTPDEEVPPHVPHVASHSLHTAPHATKVAHPHHGTAQQETQKKPEDLREDID